MFGRQTKRMLRSALISLNAAVANSQEVGVTATKAIALLDRMIAENELLRMEKATVMKGCGSITAERDVLISKLQQLDNAYLTSCGREGRGSYVECEASSLVLKTLPPLSGWAFQIFQKIQQKRSLSRSRLATVTI